MIPKPLRDRLGLRPGVVEVSADGSALRVEAVTEEALVDEGDWLVIPGSGDTLTPEQIEDLRDADRR